MADERSVEERMAELNSLISEGKQLGVDTTALEDAIRNAEAARQNIVAAAQNQTDEAIADAESRLAQEFADWEARREIAEANLRAQVADAANAHLSEAGDADPNYSPAEAEAQRAAERERFEKSAAEAESFIEGVSSGASSYISELDASAEDIIRNIDETMGAAINDELTDAYTEDTGATADNIEDHFRERVAEYVRFDMAQSELEKELKKALPGEILSIEEKLSVIEASKQMLISEVGGRKSDEARRIVNAAKQIQRQGVFSSIDEVTPEALPDVSGGYIAKEDGTPELSAGRTRRIERKVGSEMRDLEKMERKMEPLMDEFTYSLTADVAKLYELNLEDSKNALIMDDLSVRTISLTHDEIRFGILDEYTKDYGVEYLKGSDEKPIESPEFQRFVEAQHRLDSFAHQCSVMEYLERKVDNMVGQYIFENNALYEVKRNGKKGKEIIKATDVGDEIFKGLPKDAKISPEQVEERLRQYAKNSTMEVFVEKLGAEGSGLFFGKHGEGDDYIYSAQMEALFTKAEIKEIEEIYESKREELMADAIERARETKKEILTEAGKDPNADPTPVPGVDPTPDPGTDPTPEPEKKDKKPRPIKQLNKPIISAFDRHPKTFDADAFVKRYSKFLTQDMQVEVCDMLLNDIRKSEKVNQKKVDKALKKKYKKEKREKKQRDKETKREKSIYDKKTPLFKKCEQEALLNMRKKNKNFNIDDEKKGPFEKVIDHIKKKVKSKDKTKNKDPKEAGNEAENESEDEAESTEETEKPKNEKEEKKNKKEKEKTEKTNPIENFLKGFIKKHEKEEAAKTDSEKSMGDKLKEFGESVKSAVSQKAQELAGNIKGLFEGRQGSDTPTNDNEEIIRTDGLGDVGITPRGMSDPTPTTPTKNTGNAPTQEEELPYVPGKNGQLYERNEDGTPNYDKPAVNWDEKYGRKTSSQPISQDTYDAYSTEEELPEMADDGKWYYKNPDGTRGMEWRRLIQNENGVEHCEGTSEEFGYEPDDWVIGTNPETGEQGTYALHGDEIDYNRSLAEEHIPLGYRGIDPNNPQQQNDGADDDDLPTA